MWGQGITLSEWGGGTADESHNKRRIEGQSIDGKEKSKPNSPTQKTEGRKLASN